jgi:hypothetical protein
MEGGGWRARALTYVKRIGVGRAKSRRQRAPESDIEPQSAQRQQRVRAGLLASPSLRSLWPLWLPQHRLWGGCGSHRVPSCRLQSTEVDKTARKAGQAQD